MPYKDPFNFDAVPDNPEAEQRGATPYDDEWKDHKNLTYLLLREGVPIEQINAAMGEIRTVEDLAAVNAALFTLADEHRIPREWLVKQLDKKRSKAQSNGGTPMTWLKKAGPLDGPEMEHQLPTKKRPDFGGSVEDGMPAGPSDPSAGPMPGGPKPPAKPGLPGLPPAGPKGPGGKGPAGADEVKMLLEKGDLQAALEALKKLLPGGGDKSPAPPHKAPNLGKPPEKKDDKTPAKPAPGAAPEEKDEKPEEGKPKASYAARTLQCGACNIVLEASCPTCDGEIVPKEAE